MARRRSQNKDVILDDLREIFALAPWWVGPPVMACTWILFRYALPGMAGLFLADKGEDPFASSLINGVAMFASVMAPFATAVVAFVWIISLVQKFINARRVDRQTGIDSIRQLPWREFEQMLAEVFQRQGYAVTETGPGADGGIDLILHKDGQQTIVQAKQWQARQVGVKIVREMLGLRLASQAHEAMIVTSGRFTHEATQFAQANGVRLIDGEQLEPMIAGVQKSPRIVTAVGATPEAPACPLCDSVMVKRVARKGAHAGQPFWGCPQYPSCRGTRPV